MAGGRHDRATLGPRCGWQTSHPHAGHRGVTSATITAFNPTRAVQCRGFAHPISLLAEDGDAFLVVANHWKSKTDDSDPLYPGDTEDTSSPAVDRGAFNVTRAREAQDTLTFANQRRGRPPS